MKTAIIYCLALYTLFPHTLADAKHDDPTTDYHLTSKHRSAVFLKIMSPENINAQSVTLNFGTEFVVFKETVSTSKNSVLTSRHAVVLKTFKL